MIRAAALLLLLATPAWAQSSPQPTTPEAALLDALKRAPTEQAATALEAQIRARWRDAASPAVKLLLGRAQRELGENAPGEALDSFDAALDLEPDLLDAWRGRATARLRLGDPAGAARDIAEVLKREPRNFAAWQDMSRIAEARGDPKGALAAWQRFLDLNPRAPGAIDRLHALERKLNGEDA